MSQTELLQRLKLAQQQTEDAEEKIQRILNLVKKSKADEEAKIPYHLKNRYKDAIIRKKKAVEKIGRIQYEQELLNSDEPRQWQPIKQAPKDHRRAQMFSKEGMKTELPKEGFAGRQAQLPKQSSIPLFLKHCKEFLEINGVVKKIFSKPGNSNEIQQLLAKQNDPNFNIEMITSDPYTVAQAMMKWFSEKPNPMIPESLTNEFASIYGMDINDQKIPNKLHESVNKIDETNLEILNFMFRFLSEFAELDAETKMEAADLTLIWAPIFFRSNSRVNLATEAMMKYYSFVFSKKKWGRTFGVSKQKVETSTQDYSSQGYIDNRFNYMARGYS